MAELKLSQGSLCYFLSWSSFVTFVEMQLILQYNSSAVTIPMHERLFELVDFACDLLVAFQESILPVKYLKHLLNLISITSSVSFLFSKIFTT